MLKGQVVEGHQAELAENELEMTLCINIRASRGGQIHVSTCQDTWSDARSVNTERVVYRNLLTMFTDLRSSCWRSRMRWPIVFSSKHLQSSPGQFRFTVRKVVEDRNCPDWDLNYHEMKCRRSCRTYKRNWCSANEAVHPEPSMHDGRHFAFPMSVFAFMLVHS